MEKYIYDESNGLTYELIGDYYYPMFEVPPAEERYIGKWGERRWKYLKENKKILFRSMVTSMTLDSHLADIEEEAEAMYERLEKKMKEREGVTEQLKKDDMFEWVRKMNSIKNRAEEIVNNEIIYCQKAQGKLNKR